MGKRFLIYGFIGVGLEILWTGTAALFRGDLAMNAHSSIWMFPIYGMMVLLEPIHEQIRNWPIAARGGVYAFLIYLGEFTSGFLLRTTIGACPWNYGQLPFSFHGLVTLCYLPAWFILGLFFELLHDTLVTLLKQPSKQQR